MERFTLHYDEYGSGGGEDGKTRLGGVLRGGEGQPLSGGQMDSLETEYAGRGSDGQHGQLRAGNCRAEGLRLYLG